MFEPKTLRFSILDPLFLVAAVGVRTFKVYKPLIDIPYGKGGFLRERLLHGYATRYGAFKYFKKLNHMVVL